MDNLKRVGFVAFGEVNTPYQKLVEKHDEALSQLDAPDTVITDGGIVIDDVKYEAAEAAIAKLKNVEMDCLIICVCGWIPTHAVVRVTDEFRHLPMVLWGLSAWRENGRIVTATAQAGTTALRPTFEALGYKFKYVYSIIDKPTPIGSINAFIAAAHAKRILRHAHVGTMGYRDMLLYGTQFEGSSLRKQIGIEVEPYEMLEMVQTSETIDEAAIDEGIAYVKSAWHFDTPFDDDIIRKGVTYALAIGKKIEERNWDAISIIDVDGMKKLLGFPPTMIFMLIDHWCKIETTPENDIMGNITQLMLKALTNETAMYLEYYEFFEKSMFLGVPDYVPEAAVDGDIRVIQTAFGLFDSSLLNVSMVKPGRVTCSRLKYLNGEYYMHVYTGTGKTPPPWNEFGWDDPAPQPPSLEVFPDCGVEEFAQKVSSQHVIVTYGDDTEALMDLCDLLDIEVI